MATYSRTTRLDSAEVLKRAAAFFGVGGIGLEVVLQGDSCVRFVGVGGHVQVTVQRVLGESAVELETREWDYQVREFMGSLPPLDIPKVEARRDAASRQAQPKSEDGGPAWPASRMRRARGKERQMDIPVGVEVFCTDGLGGRSTYVIIDPVTERVSHVVVKEHGGEKKERLVSLESVKDTDRQTIRLSLSKQELATMKPFVQTEYVETTVQYMGYAPDVYMLQPYVVPMSVLTPYQKKLVPADELEVHRGEQVLARDGRIGRLDEFLVDPSDGHITHLVLREGHLWGQREVTIPVSEIDHYDHNSVFLKLGKRAIGKLPSVAVPRHILR